MINRNEQHRRPDLEQGERTGPVDFDHLLTIAARIGVPVMRAHRGRLEVHEPEHPRLGSALNAGGEQALPSLSPETAENVREQPEEPGFEQALAGVLRSRRGRRSRRG